MIEDWQEKITVQEPRYFKGSGKFKFRGEFDAAGSDGNRHDYFENLEIYDLEIPHIIELSKAEYEGLKKGPALEDIRGSIKANYNDKTYRIKPTECFVNLSDGHLERKHTMVDEGQVHGYFETELAFKIEKPKEIIKCKAGFQTGNEHYSNKWRGNWIEMYQEDCTLVWRFVPDIPPCVDGTPTGKKERNIESCQIRYEYKDDWCQPYWGEWEKILNIKGTPTGKTRVRNGFTEREFYDEDCQTYWKAIPTNPGFDWGCLGNLISILLFSIVGILLLVALFSNFYILVIPLAIFGLIYVLSRPRIANLVSRLFGFIGGILFLLMLAGMAYGIYNAFSGNLAENNPYIPEIKDDDSHEQRTEKNEKNEIDSLIYHHRVWYDYQENKYEGSYYIRFSDIQKSKSNIDTYRNPINEIGQVYKRAYEHDKDYLDGVFIMLDSIKENEDLNQIEFAKMVVSFVQDITYVLIIEEGCYTYRDATVRDLLADGVACQGNIPWGLNTPVQFLANLKGDCDTRTVLIYTLLKHYGYDVVIMNSDHYGHSMIGINLPFNGIYKSADNKRYYFWETTAIGFRPGVLPKDFGNTNYWYIALY